MSGTAPSDPAPGGHATDYEPTSLDSKQHGQAQNIIDETKDSYGSMVDRDIGENIDSGKTGGGISDRAQGILNRTSDTGAASGAGKKGEKLTEQGFKVGEEADFHDLAKSKQP